MAQTKLEAYKVSAVASYTITYSINTNIQSHIVLQEPCNQDLAYHPSKILLLSTTPQDQKNSIFALLKLELLAKAHGVRTH